MRGLTGRLLVASPQLDAAEAFRRSVVLMLNHSDTGAMGVVINHPLDVDVAAVLPVWQPHVTLPGRLFRGGPVHLDSALGLVQVPGDSPEPEGVHRLVGSLGLVDLDTPPEVMVGAVAGLRIFAGYAGWSAGQLEGEIGDGSWFVVEAEARDAFSDAPGELWGRVLRRQRGSLSFVSTYPPDVSHN